MTAETRPELIDRLVWLYCDWRTQCAGVRAAYEQFAVASAASRPGSRVRGVSGGARPRGIGRCRLRPADTATRQCRYAHDPANPFAAHADSVVET